MQLTSNLAQAFSAYPTLYIAVIMVALQHLSFLWQKVTRGLGSKLDWEESQPKRKKKKGPQVAKFDQPESDGPPEIP